MDSSYNELYFLELEYTKFIKQKTNSINTKNAVRNKHSEQTVFLPEDGGCCVPGKQNIFFYY